MALYGAGQVEIALPETDEPAAVAVAKAITSSGSRGDPQLLCGVVVYPHAATTVDGILELALRAVHDADEATAVKVAPRAVHTWRPAADGPSLPLLDGQPLVASAAMRSVFEMVERLAPTLIPVLILGETGAGKEVVARAIHERGPRRNKPMLCVNCATIPAQLIESTLFGHERGAFTGANQRQKGVFEAADGGIVMLDEIGELPAQAQAALLRALETKRIVRVGSNDEIAVDVRVVAATNRDLEAMCTRGSFRRDLLYRLNAITLTVPPCATGSKRFLLWSSTSWWPPTPPTAAMSAVLTQKRSHFSSATTGQATCVSSATQSNALW